VTVDIPELLDRIAAVDPDAIEAAAAEMTRASAAFETERDRVRGLRQGSQQVDWKGAAKDAWDMYTTECADKLSSAGYALTLMSEILKTFAGIARDCKTTVRAEQSKETYAPQQYQNPEDAQLLYVTVARKYHAAEQDARGRLWTLGDSADVGPPPAAVVPPPPKKSWWQGLLFGPDNAGPQFDQNGDPIGYDEDGNTVAGYRAAEIAYIQILEDGVGGALARLLSRAGRAGRLGSRAAGAAGDEAAAGAFADDIAASNAWRPSHVDDKIREWYNLKATDPIPDWMRTDFLKTMGRASAQSSGPFSWDVAGQKSATVLYRDPTTKQWMAVSYYADGARAGEFMSVIKPGPEKLDEMLRAAATRQVR
jgi:hypothetical protein